MAQNGVSTAIAQITAVSNAATCFFHAALRRKISTKNKYPASSAAVNRMPSPRAAASNPADIPNNIAFLALGSSVLRRKYNTAAIRKNVFAESSSGAQ